MVFKVDFVGDMGNAPEPAAVDPKAAFYLADTLRKTSREIGNVLETGVEAYKGVDTFKRTQALGEELRETTDLLHQGDIALAEEQAAAKAQFDWEKDVAEFEGQAPEKIKAMTSAFETKLQTIEAGLLQKGIGYKEAVYRWNKALKEAIAARPSLASEFRAISGKYTGSGDWDHYYIKESAQRFAAEEQAKVQAAKDQAKQQQELFDKTANYFTSLTGQSPDTVVSLLNSEEGNRYLRDRERINAATSGIKLQTEQLNAQGALDTQSANRLLNATMGTASMSLLADTNMQLLASNDNVINKYVVNGKFDYDGISKDMVAMEHVRSLLKQNVLRNKAVIMQGLSEQLKTSTADPKTLYASVDAWEKQITGMLEGSAQESITFLKFYQAQKDGDVKRAVELAAATNTVGKALGIDPLISGQFHTMTPEQFTKIHGQAKYDSYQRFYSWASEAGAFAGRKISDSLITIEDLTGGTPVKPLGADGMLTQEQADARDVVFSEYLAKMTVGELNPADAKTVGTLKTISSSLAPTGQFWDGPNGLYQNIISGKFSDLVDQLQPQEALPIINTMRTKVLDYTNNFETTPIGQRTIKASIGNIPGAVVKKVMVGQPDPASGIAQYRYTLTIPNNPTVVSTFDAIGGMGAEMARPKYDVGTLEKTLNENMARALGRSYGESKRAMQVLNIIATNPNMKQLEVPKNTGKKTAAPTEPVMLEGKKGEAPITIQPSEWKVSPEMQAERDRVSMDIKQAELTDYINKLAADKAQLRVAKERGDTELVKQLEQAIKDGNENINFVTVEIDRLQKK